MYICQGRRYIRHVHPETDVFQNHVWSKHDFENRSIGAYTNADWKITYSKVLIFYRIFGNAQEQDAYIHVCAYEDIASMGKVLLAFFEVESDFHIQLPRILQSSVHF